MIQLDAWTYDLRFALRALARDRAFTLTAVVTLALAIGLNVTVFAVTSTMLLRGFPLVRDNADILYIQESYPSGGCCVAYASFADWRAEARSFDDLAFVSGRELTIADRSGAGTIDTNGAVLSANGFGLLDVRPALGRDFVAADEAADAAPVAILSHRFWSARYGASENVVGQTIEVDSVPTTVIGVMPEGFDFPSRQNLWLPVRQTAELRLRAPNRGYLAFGRLASGHTLDGARSELETINRRLAADYPDTNRGVVPRVETFASFFMGRDVARVYGSMWAGAWFVLLIACANLANLSLARALRRSRELATRVALGAGRARTIRQILTETALLALASGALGGLVALSCVRAWEVATYSQYQVLDYSIGFGTFAYLCAITAGAALAIAAAPVVRAWRAAARGLPSINARGTTRGAAHKRFSAALVMTQMTLAIVLLSGAGVLARSFFNVVGADVGVTSPELVLTGFAAVPRAKNPTAEQRAAFFGALRARLASVPGIESASVSNTRPVNNLPPQRFEIEGLPFDPARPQAEQVPSAGADYFRAVGAAVLAGREFDERDGLGAPLVAVVNERFVVRYLEGREPLGARIRLFDGNVPGEWRTIVGVVSNVMQGEPTRQRFLPLAYVPFAQQPSAGVWLFARAATMNDALAARVRDEVRAFDADLTLSDFTTLEAGFRFIPGRMDIEHVEMGKHAAVAPIFAALALLLAGVGLYAVVAHGVTQRTREIGLRLAVGAAASDIRRMIFRDGLQPVAAGLLCGVLASLGVNRVLESQLVGVATYDPAALAAAAAVVLGVALLACQLPSRRAMAVDPAITLRDD